MDLIMSILEWGAVLLSLFLFIAMLVHVTSLLDD